jgi:hypothetical protein
MTWYPVSTRVNSVRHDDPACIERVPGADALLPFEESGASAGDVAPPESDEPPQAKLF